MINKKSIQAVENSNFNSFFKKPLYSSYCFSNIPALIENCLGINSNLNLPKDVLGNLPQKYEKVILFFIDGFGWRFVEKFTNHPFLKKISTDGVISKITSQFPSTTAAHVTKIHTNLTVGESGIYEWFYYEPRLDRIITPLFFSFAGDKKRDSLKKTKINPVEIYPKKTFYQKLKNAGVNSYIFQHQEYTPSTYSDIVFKGGQVFGYKTLAEAIVNLFQIFSIENEKSYYFLYFDKIDSLSHTYGPISTQVEAEIESFLSIMEKIFLKFFTKSKNTLFLLTADHGQVEVNPKTTIYLNRKFPQIKKWIKKNKKGKLLAPAGSCRDMFLYIKEEYLNEAKNYLQEKLKGKAEVYFTKDLINQGLFGKKISNEFLNRVGNLVILSYKGESVWWYQKGRFEQKFYGHHGGLTEEEIVIPLVILSS